jgi:hypothetical protein
MLNTLVSFKLHLTAKIYYRQEFSRPINISPGCLGWGLASLSPILAIIFFYLRRRLRM